MLLGNANGTLTVTSDRDRLSDGPKRRARRTRRGDRYIGAGAPGSGWRAVLKRFLGEACAKGTCEVRTWMFWKHTERRLTVTSSPGSMHGSERRAWGTRWGGDGLDVDHWAEDVLFEVAACERGLHEMLRRLKSEVCTKETEEIRMGLHSENANGILTVTRRVRHGERGRQAG
jgi:hypothetical protein